MSDTQKLEKLFGFHVGRYLIVNNMVVMFSPLKSKVAAQISSFFN